MRKVKVISAIAAGLLTASLSAASVSASTTADRQINVNWSSSTNGSLTTYSAEIFYRLSTSEFASCTNAKLIGTVFRHYANGWNSTVTNISSITRYQAASTRLYDIIHLQWIYAAEVNSTGNTVTNGVKSATSTYSNFPTKYYLYWLGVTSGGASSYAPDVEKVQFYERHV